MQVANESLRERRITVAEPAEHSRAGRAEDAVHVNTEFALGERFVRRSNHRCHHREGIGQRRHRSASSERLEICIRERDLCCVRTPGLLQLAEQELLARSPRYLPSLGGRREQDAGEQRRGLRRER